MDLGPPFSLGRLCHNLSQYYMEEVALCHSAAWELKVIKPLWIFNGHIPHILRSRVPSEPRLEYFQEIDK